MTPVDSSAIAEIAYLAVPPEIHAAFLAAPSKGAYFHARIDPAFSFLRLNA